MCMAYPTCWCDDCHFTCKYTDVHTLAASICIVVSSLYGRIYRTLIAHCWPCLTVCNPIDMHVLASCRSKSTLNMSHVGLSAVMGFVSCEWYVAQVLGMRLIRKARLAPNHHECAYLSFNPSERDGTWIELLLSDPAKVSLLSHVHANHLLFQVLNVFWVCLMCLIGYCCPAHLVGTLFLWHNQHCAAVRETHIRQCLRRCQANACTHVAVSIQRMQAQTTSNILHFWYPTFCMSFCT